jgi:hypothetical protein
VERLRSALPRRAIARRLLNRLVPPLTWLRPDGANRGRMLRVLQRALDERRLYVEFMLHSSELMPGGSRRFPDSSSIEKLYSDMHAVFAAAARCFRAATLGEFARSLASGASPVLGEPVPRSTA